MYMENNKCLTGKTIFSGLVPNFYQKSDTTVTVVMIATAELLNCTARTLPGLAHLSIAGIATIRP